MVDNFALLVSQLMMIVVLWRCYTLPGEPGIEDRKRTTIAPRRRRDKRDGKG